MAITSNSEIGTFKNHAESSRGGAASQKKCRRRLREGAGVPKNSHACIARRRMRLREGRPTPRTEPGLSVARRKARPGSAPSKRRWDGGRMCQAGLRPAPNLTSRDGRHFWANTVFLLFHSQNELRPLFLFSFPVGRRMRRRRFAPAVSMRRRGRVTAPALFFMRARLGRVSFAVVPTPRRRGGARRGLDAARPRRVICRQRQLGPLEPAARVTGSPALRPAGSGWSARLERPLTRGFHVGPYANLGAIESEYGAFSPPNKGLPG